MSQPARDTAEIARLREALENARGAVQAFQDMVAVMRKWQALPIPAILDTAAHNCPIILEQIRSALEEKP